MTETPEQVDTSSAADADDSAGPLPPDPAEYDSERNVLARARGLNAPYIAGGRDPEPEAGLREERKFLRLLLLMVGAIIVGGFVLGIVANVIGAMGTR